MNGNGAIDLTGDAVHFDLDSDGVPEQLTDWVSSADALLVDLAQLEAGNGLALFGDDDGTYHNGFEKLAALRDSNSDGAITGPELTGLGLWFDDGDTTMQPDEVAGLDAYAVIAINLDHEPGLTSYATLADGEQLFVQDIILPSVTVGVEAVAVPAAEPRVWPATYVAAGLATGLLFWGWHRETARRRQQTADKTVPDTASVI